MRRTLAGLMPEWSAIFHLRPYDLDVMTVREIAAYLHQTPRFRGGGTNG